MKKTISVMLVFVMAFGAFGGAAPAAADYRTGSAVGDAAAYGAGGAAVGAGSYVAVTWLGCIIGGTAMACPPVTAIALAASAGCAYLGWYGATDSDKTLEKDIENTVMAGALGVTAGSWAAEKVTEKGIEAALQAAY